MQGDFIEPGAVLDQEVEVAVAGVRVRVASNSADVIDVARRRFAPPENAKPGPVCLLNVQVVRSREAAPNVIDVRWDFPDGDHAFVSAEGLAADVDLAAGSATVRVDDWFLRNDAQFRRTVLEGIVYSLLGRRGRHPVHAAALRAGQAALLLHGSSGVGKSTLAYVASRAGIDVLADDAVRIQLVPEFCVWGDGVPARIHLLERARHEFPELRDHKPERISAAGVLKLAVSALEPRASWSPYARAARVCLLARHAGAAVVRDAAPDEIRDTLFNAPEAASDREPEQRRGVVDALAAAGGWHLTLSGRAADAMPHLRRMLAQIAPQATPEPASDTS